MKTLKEIETALNCKISWKFRGFVPTPKDWGSNLKDKGLHARHPRYAININGQSFQFTGSGIDGEQGKKDLTEEELLWAVNCVAGDVVDTREYSFSEWASNLGYSDDSIKAQKIYRACQKEDKKLTEAGVDPYDLADMTREDDD